MDPMGSVAGGARSSAPRGGHDWERNDEEATDLREKNRNISWFIGKSNGFIWIIWVFPKIKKVEIPEPCY